MIIKNFILFFIVNIVLSQECKKIHVRREIRDLSKQERNAFFNAIKKLNSGSRPTPYDDLASLHVKHTKSIHKTPVFLPWHRYYIFVLESKLREIDPNVVLPYWDWSKDSQAPEKSEIFTSEFFGGTGTKENLYCVPDGPFSKFEVLTTDKGPDLHCLRRSFDDGTKISSLAPPEVVESTIKDNPDFEKFSRNFEKSPHALPHNNIGGGYGDFSQHSSPNDPLFWVHHGFVDKIWSEWQNKKGSEAFVYKSPRTKQSMVNYEISVDDVMDSQEYPLCYTYDTLPARRGGKKPSKSSDITDTIDKPSNATEPATKSIQSDTEPATKSVQSDPEPMTKSTQTTTTPSSKSTRTTTKPTAKSTRTITKSTAKPTRTTTKSTAKPTRTATKSTVKPTKSVVRLATKPTQRATKPATKTIHGTTKPTTKPARRIIRTITRPATKTRVIKTKLTSKPTGRVTRVITKPTNKPTRTITRLTTKPTSKPGRRVKKVIKPARVVTKPKPTRRIIKPDTSPARRVVIKRPTSTRRVVAPPSRGTILEKGTSQSRNSVAKDSSQAQKASNNNSRKVRKVVTKTVTTRHIRRATIPSLDGDASNWKRYPNLALSGLIRRATNIIPGQSLFRRQELTLPISKDFSKMLSGACPQRLCPSATDRDNQDKLRVPNPIPESYILRFGMDVDTFRQSELNIANTLYSFNSNPNYVSKVSLRYWYSYHKVTKSSSSHKTSQSNSSTRHHIKKVVTKRVINEEEEEAEEEEEEAEAEEEEESEDLNDDDDDEDYDDEDEDED